MRERILRPGQTPEQLCYPGDGEPDTLHAAVLEGGVAVGVASVMREPHPREPAPGDWRLRGMATCEQARGRGVGAALLGLCEAHVRARGGTRLWCNARTGARAFYERAGLAAESEVFEIPGIGPHVLMSMRLEGS